MVLERRVAEWSNAPDSKLKNRSCPQRDTRGLTRLHRRCLHFPNLRKGTQVPPNEPKNRRVVPVSNGRVQLKSSFSNNSKCISAHLMLICPSSQGLLSRHNVCFLAAGADIGVGDEALPNQQPHDAVVAHVILVPNHFANDRRVKAWLDVVHGPSTIISKT